MNQHTRSILVVDDEPEIRNLVRDLLEARGFYVLEASDGLQALDMVKRHRPGFVLMDLVMPRVSGIEVIRDIQRIDDSIRIAVLSGHVTEEVETTLGRLGVRVVKKPIELRELHSVIG